MSGPDVSVVIPVFNTMPYLTATLDSLLRQSIGLDRIQVVAVDDGSTDGSGEELDRYAQRHPESFVVVHQPNSGGPASPCNRGLELAEGRYVFFLGADDYLGDEALERLVTKADEWGSDVIFGRMEGLGGRVVYQGIFSRTEPDLDFVDSDLAFSLSNTKLFRRELLEKHDIHYARDLRVGSDQPFTIEAMLHARKVSVLADYTCYYAVKRGDETNISYSHRWHQRVADIGAIMHHVADILPPGVERDAILRRHFGWELTKTFRDDFAHLDEDEQAELVKAVAALADTYLTDRVSDRINAEPRVMLRLAQAGDLATLRELVATREDALRLLALDGERVYSVLPGFRDQRGLPDAWFDVTDKRIRGRLVSGVGPARVRLADTTLSLDLDVPFTADSAPRLRITLQQVPAGTAIPGAKRLRPYDVPAGLDVPVELVEREAGRPTALHADVDLAPLLESDAPAKTRWSVRLRADAGPWTYDLPLEPEGARQVVEARRGRRAHRLIVGQGQRGPLFVRRETLPAAPRRALWRAFTR